MAAPSRIQVGDQVRILSNLHLRSAPEIGNNIQQTNLAGTVLEVIGGPVCTPYQGGAYLWWQVRLDSGVSGWSAEATGIGAIYYLEPIQ